jgi:uncharacterized integral membrane protein (TIGR00698 family)
VTHRAEPDLEAGAAGGAEADERVGLSDVARLKSVLPGVFLCATIAMAAAFIAQRYGGPHVLYALLLGLALHTLGREPALSPGIGFCSRTVLRVGVALLGARITLPVLFELGLGSAVLVVVAVATTIGLGWLASRLLKRPVEQGIVSGGAVAICGVSAALAIASVFPRRPELERFTVLVAAGVTLLSTVAMVVYPLIASSLAFDTVQTSIFLGGSIHDVAQVVAAGMMVSQQTADSATVVKLFRVALLVPVVFFLAIGIGMRSRQPGGGAARPPLLPGFLIAFCVLVALSSAGVFPPPVVALASETSRWLLVVAIAAVGIKSSPAELARMGWIPAAMLLVETAFIALAVLAGIVLAARIG